MYSTCRDLHVIAAHVLGRRRFAVSGHFGLRASPRGVATPAFGPEPEVLRLAGPHLVREVGNESRSLAVDGATLAELAAFAGADLASDYSAGAGMPPPGAPDEPFHLDGRATRRPVRLVRPRLAGARHRHVRTGIRVRLVDGAVVARAFRRRHRPGSRPRRGAATSGSLRGMPSPMSPMSTSAPGVPNGRAIPPTGTHPSARSCTRADATDAATCADFLRRGLALLAGG